MINSSSHGQNQYTIKPIPAVLLGYGSPIFRKIKARKMSVNTASFKEIIRFIEETFGSMLSKHIDSYHLSLKHNNDNYIPHRLAYLYCRLQNSLITLKQDPPSGDVPALIEAAFFRDLVEIFNKGPAWRVIEPELKGSNSFVHLMTMLAYTSLLRGNGNRVTLVGSNKDEKKIADMNLFTISGDRVDIEIKAPQKLLALNEITNEKALIIIEKAWKHARGQIGKRASMLVIGGLYLPNKVLNTLEDVANTFLVKKKNKNILSITITSITMLFEDPILEGEKIKITSSTKTRSQLSFRYAINPSYEGVVFLHESERKNDFFSNSNLVSTEFQIKNRV